MANMNMRTKGPRGSLYSGNNGRLYYYENTPSKKGAGYVYPKNKFGRTGPGRPIPRPGSLAEAQANAGPLPVPGAGGMARTGFRLALRFGLQALLSDFWEQPEWAKQGGGGSGAYPLQAAGWVLACTGNPSVSYPAHKVVWWAANVAVLCAPTEEANFGATLQPGGYGVAVIPAGLRTVAFPWGNNPAQIKGQNSEVWHYPGGGTSPSPVAFASGFVMPLVDEFPDTVTQMEATPQPARAGGFLKGYQSFAMSITIDPRKPPVKNPDDVHNHVPPGRDEKEDKPLDNTGRSVKEVYGAMTELDDAFDCMEKSFKKNPDPGHLKHVPINHRLDLRALRLAQEAAAGNIDWQKFVNCMALNNLQDEVIGKANRASSRRLQNNPYSPRGHSPIGWGTGGFSTRMR